MSFWCRECKMKCRFKQILLSADSAESVQKINPGVVCHTLYAKSGFSLVETVTALIILALISSSVLVVIDRCMTSASDLSLRMQAFEVARENMETLLSEGSVEEMVEYGSSNRYPAITWQTTVEAFYEPVTQLVWARGVCTAEYTDASGQTQSVELARWITDITKEQMLEFLKQQREEDALVAERVIGTVEEAAEYAEVDVETFKQWVDNGLVATEDGSFPKDNIDIFKQSDGNPSPEAKSEQVESVEDIVQKAKQEIAEAEPDKEESPAEDDWRNEIDPVTGLTYKELLEMDFWEIWNLLDTLGY